MHKIIVKQFIHSAHQLPDSEDLVTKKCANLHGHTYLIEVEIIGVLNQAGMVKDFKWVKDQIDILDHKFINAVFIENNFIHPSTAEFIAQFLQERIGSHLGIMSTTVRVCEGYKGEENSSWVVYPY